MPRTSAFPQRSLLLFLILSAFEIVKKICWVPVNVKPPVCSLVFQVPPPPCGGCEQRPQGPHKLPVTSVRETRCQPVLTQQMQDKGNGRLDEKGSHITKTPEFPVSPAAGLQMSTHQL